MGYCSLPPAEDQFERIPVTTRGTHTRLPEGRHIFLSSRQGGTSETTKNGGVPGKFGKQSLEASVDKWHHHVGGKQQCVVVEMGKVSIPVNIAHHSKGRTGPNEPQKYFDRYGHVMA